MAANPSLHYVLLAAADALEGLTSAAFWDPAQPKTYPPQMDGLKHLQRWPEPTAKKSKGAKGAQSQTESLDVGFMDPRAVVALGLSWVKQAARPPAQKLRAANRNYLPGIGPMRTNELEFDTVSAHGYGHCWVWSMGTGATGYKRSVGNKSHVTLTPPSYLSDKEKVYGYHIMAFTAAYLPHAGLLHSDVEPASWWQVAMDDIDFTLPYTIDDLCKATKGKTATSLVICHGCGLLDCGNPYHFSVQTKLFNDDNEVCHKFLRRADTIEDYNLFRERFCPHRHEVPCWTNRYKIKELEVKRLSLSQGE